MLNAILVSGTLSGAATSIFQLMATFGHDPDFVVRSIPDDIRFGVQRSCLERGSGVFHDMFSCCDDESSVPELDLDEPANILAALLSLLHDPPRPYAPIPEPQNDDITIYCVPTESAIPLPILPMVYRLADKYDLSEDLVQTLHSHLAAHASTFPLQVYAHATSLELDSLAATTSIYLLHPPLSTYTVQDISIIPSAAAYHKLVLLHELRIARLREILQGEEIFPHGYGRCPQHGEQMELWWKKQKYTVLAVLDAGTNVAALMSGMSMTSCRVCHKAHSAAVKMLEYKCRKVPKRIDRLPNA